MNQIIYSSLLFLLLFSSCDNENKQKAISAGKDAVVQTVPINDFIKKFPVVPLPFYFKGWTESNFNRGKLFAINKNSIDSLFFKIDDDSVYGYGLLADTANFYALIFFGQAEDIYPILVTYSKSGQNLSKTELMVHGCGSDCGLSYCSETAQISVDLNIYIADTLKYKGMCDSLNNYLPNADTTFVNSRKGSIDKKGLVKLGDELIERKKNRP